MNTRTHAHTPKYVSTYVHTYTHMRTQREWHKQKGERYKRSQALHERDAHLCVISVHGSFWDQTRRVSTAGVQTHPRKNRHSVKFNLHSTPRGDKIRSIRNQTFILSYTHNHKEAHTPTCQRIHFRHRMYIRTNACIHTCTKNLHHHS